MHLHLNSYYEHLNTLIKHVFVCNSFKLDDRKKASGRETMEKNQIKLDCIGFGELHIRTDYCRQSWTCSNIWICWFCDVCEAIPILFIEIFLMFFDLSFWFSMTMHPSMCTHWIDEFDITMFYGCVMDERGVNGWEGWSYLLTTLMYESIKIYSVFAFFPSPSLYLLTSD